MLATGDVRATYPPRDTGVTARYSAFPGAVALPDGALLVVYREGTDHVAARDGVIRRIVSPDLGRTWSVPETVPSGRGDARDPSVSLSADGSVLYLTYFRTGSRGAVRGMFLRRSADGGVSWSGAVRIDPALYGGAISAPVVDDGSGTVRAVGYARGRPGEPWYSVYLFSSVDGGACWTARRVVDGPVAGRECSEPWLVAGAGRLWIFYRYGNAAELAAVTSTDGGATWWPMGRLFPGFSGRPAVVRLASGTLVLMLRRITDGSHWYAASTDDGAGWSPPRLLSRARSSALATGYACPIEVRPGLVFCPLAQEQDEFAGLARIYVSYLAEGALPEVPVLAADPVPAGD